MTAWWYPEIVISMEGMRTSVMMSMKMKSRQARLKRTRLLRNSCWRKAVFTLRVSRLVASKASSLAAKPRLRAQDEVSNLLVRVQSLGMVIRRLIRTSMAFRFCVIHIRFWWITRHSPKIDHIKLKHTKEWRSRWLSTANFLIMKLIWRICSSLIDKFQTAKNYLKDQKSDFGSSEKLLIVYDNLYLRNFNF